MLKGVLLAIAIFAFVILQFIIIFMSKLLIHPTSGTPSVLS
jgi:hypothetical protein